MSFERAFLFRLSWSFCATLIALAGSKAIGETPPGHSSVHRPPHLSRFWKRVEQWVKTGQKGRAILALEQRLERHPEEAQLAFRLCEILIPIEETLFSSRLQSAPAERCERALLALSASDPSVERTRKEWLRWAQMFSGKLDLALEKLEAEGLDESTIPFLEKATFWSIRKKDFDTALRSLRLIEKLRPRSATVLVDLALLHLVRGESREATLLLRRALLLDASSREIRHDLAGALAQHATLSQAEAILVELLRGEPSFGLLLELSIVRFEQGNLLGAREAAREAGRLAPPGEALPWLILGDIERRLGNPRAARAAYEEALRRDPNSIRARRSLESLAHSSDMEAGAWAPGASP
ncbi:MAG: tetratricopeptide repeat protein [Deltaproteobacteria bacterium]|nr:tetratricopeptide repeat protein [Deltaproteobacteria bacterium]